MLVKLHKKSIKVTPESGLLWSIEQSNATAYKLIQICYHFEYLTILTVNNLILPFKLFQVSVISCEDVGCHICLGLLWSIIGVTFLAALGLLWLPLGVTLIKFLVWYNQCKTVWNIFKVQNLELDNLVIFLHLYAVKT